MLVSAGSIASEPDPSALMLRMQMTINHGVSMAATGAILVTQSTLHRQGEQELDVEGVDLAAAQQGRDLIMAGKALIVEAASGKSMMRLHSAALSKSESAQMIKLHRLEGAALAYIKTLESLVVQ
jgi:hypothetical protein